MDTSAPPAGIAAEACAATPLAVQQVLLATLTLLTLQQQQMAQLLARVAGLEARLNQHSPNASKPPSSDPPSAPPRPSRVPRGRKAGGHAGHPRHERPIPDPEQITTTDHHYPSTCQQCRTDVTASQRDACARETQYGCEIVAVQPLLTAHHYHTVWCQGCGELVRATRPPDLPPGGFGPRTTAVVSMLHGRYRISQREAVNLLADLLQLPLSLGSVVTLQTTVSTALAPITADIQTHVQADVVAGVDETGGKEAGKRCWLWTMVTAMTSCFAVATSRNGPAPRHLLGTAYRGMVGSDRDRPYLALLPERHHLCWSQLIGNFTFLRLHTRL